MRQPIHTSAFRAYAIRPYSSLGEMRIFKLFYGKTANKISVPLRLCVQIRAQKYINLATLKKEMENIFKGKINFLKVQLELKTKYPEQKEIINQEIDGVNQVLDDGINSKLTEVITTDIKGDSYYG